MGGGQFFYPEAIAIATGSEGSDALEVFARRNKFIVTDVSAAQDFREREGPITVDENAITFYQIHRIF